MSFERRQAKDVREQRLVAEQTEPPLEQPVVSWPGWDCGELCNWLRERMDGPDATTPEVARGGEEPSPAPGRAGGAQLSIQQVAIVDATGRVDAVSDGMPTAQEFACTATGWLEVNVLGAAPQQEVLVALRLRASGGPGRSAGDPAAVPREGPARIELSEAGVGVHSAHLVAWTPDASAAPGSVQLGALTIHPVE